jgi:hypothetical protein
MSTEPSSSNDAWSVPLNDWNDFWQRLGTFNNLSSDPTHGAPMPTEEEWLAKVDRLIATNDRAAWEQTQRKTFFRVYTAGFFQVFERLVAYHGPDPKRYEAALHEIGWSMSTAGSAKPGAEVRQEARAQMFLRCLSLSQGVPFSDQTKEDLPQVFLTLRPAPGRPAGDVPLLPRLLQPLLEDGRMNDFRSQYRWWQKTGEQGQLLAVPLLKAWYDRLAVAGQEHHPHAIAAAWDKAYFTAISGSQPERACATVAEMIRPWLTEDEWKAYYRWEGNPLWSSGGIGWRAYDLILFRRIQGPDDHPEEVPPSWDLVAMRDALYAIAGEQMPLETSRRRQDTALEAPVSSTKRPRVRA